MHLYTRLAYILLPAVLLFGFAMTAFADTDDWYEYEGHAYLKGSEEVPPTNTNASGHSYVTWSGDGSEMYQTLDVWNGRNITQAHLHCGDPGENGPVVVTQYHNAIDGINVNGRLSEGWINDGNIASTGENCDDYIGMEINTVEDLAEALKNGDIYANVHSEQYPNGEIRGQVWVQNSNDGHYDHNSYNNHDSKDWSDKDWYDNKDHSYGHGGSYDDGYEDWDHKNGDNDYKHDWKGDHHSYDWYDSDKNGHHGYDHDKDWNGWHDGKDGKDGHDGYSHKDSNYHYSHGDKDWDTNDWDGNNWDDTNNDSRHENWDNDSRNRDHSSYDRHSSNRSYEKSYR